PPPPIARAVLTTLGAQPHAHHLPSLTQGLSLQITDDDPAGRRFR
ncbi:hypothetical protein, partial [Pseudomonas aeruginosa]